MRAHTERDDRKSRPVRWDEEPDADGEIYQQYRHGQRLPRLHEFGGLVHLRAPLRRVGRVAAARARLRGVHRSRRSSPAVARRVRPRARRRPRRVLVGGAARRGRGVTSPAAATRQSSRATRCSGRCASNATATRWSCHKYTAHLDDPVRRHRRRADDDRHVVRPGRRPARVGDSSAPARAYGLYSRFGQATPRGERRVHRLPRRSLAVRGHRACATAICSAPRYGVVGYETVGVPTRPSTTTSLPIAAGGDGTPADIEVVAVRARRRTWPMGEYPASIAALDDQGDLEFVAERLYGDVDADT